jgi:hypothetical protein
MHTEEFMDKMIWLLRFTFKNPGQEGWGLEHLPNKHKALSSSASTIKNNPEKGEKKNGEEWTRK